MGATVRNVRWWLRVLGLLGTGRRDLAKESNLLPSMYPTGATIPADDRFCGLMLMAVLERVRVYQMLYTARRGLTRAQGLTKCYLITYPNSAKPIFAYDATRHALVRLPSMILSAGTPANIESPIQFN